MAQEIDGIPIGIWTKLYSETSNDIFEATLRSVNLLIEEGVAAHRAFDMIAGTLRHYATMIDRENAARATPPDPGD